MRSQLHTTLSAIMLIAVFSTGAIDGLVRSVTRTGPIVPWTDGFPEEEKCWFVSLNGLLQRLSGRRTVSNSKDIDVVLLDNGQLALGSVARTSGERRKAARDISRALKPLRDELAKSGIPLVFVLCPAKVPPGGKGLPCGIEDDDNLLGDALVESLSDSGIECLDLRKRIAEDHLDHASLFFRTDHHWNPTAGLWAANQIAMQLRECHEMDFNLELTSPDRYSKLRVRDRFLGSLGKRVGPWFAGCEAFDALVPCSPTSFKLDIPGIGFCQVGSFEKLLMHEIDIRKGLWNDDPYGAYLAGQQPLAYIENNTGGNGVKLCVVKDSFASVLLPHLAMHCGKLILLDPRNDQHLSVLEIVGQEGADAVLFILNPNSLIRRFGFFGGHFLGR